MGGLKNLYNSIKKEGYIIKDLDQYLISLNAKDNDRALNVNAPSQAGGCMRANFYARTGVQPDGSIDPRARRIFNNGDHVHIRLQEYLEKCGKLLMDEVPLINEEYNIQGHTDGFLKLNAFDVGILEIKSINDNGFTQLKDAKEEHKKQAMVYVYCAECRRLYLKETYKSEAEFKKSVLVRRKYFAQRYSYFKDGSKYTAKKKQAMQVKLCLKADEILFNTPRPIDTVVFLYENKNNQELKEYAVKIDEEILNGVLNDYNNLNAHIQQGVVPDRVCPNKGCRESRYCNYRLECFC